MVNTIKKIIDLIKQNKILAIVSMCHYLLSFLFDTFIFNGFGNILNVIYYLGCKGIFFFVVIIMWYYIFKLIKGIKNKDKNTYRFLTYFVIYFSVMFVFYLLTFPGMWRHDDFFIAKDALYHAPFFWHHYLTSVYFSISLMLCFEPMFLVFVQIVLVSIIISYILYIVDDVIYNRIGKHSRLVLLLFIPFFFPSVISNNLFMFRSVMYGYLELLFLFNLALVIFDKKYLTKTFAATMAVLFAVVVNWRSESIVYYIVIPVAILLLKNIVKIKTMLKYLGVCLGLAVIVYSPQFMGELMAYGFNYKFTALMLPLHSFVQVDKEKNPNSEEILILDEYFDTDEFITYVDGEWAYWNMYELNSLFITEDIYNEFFSVYKNYIFKYPGTFLKNRLKTMLYTNSIGKDDYLTTVQSVIDMEYKDIYNGSEVNDKVLNSKIRNATVKFLKCRNLKDISKKSFTNIIFWNFLPSILITAVAAIVLLIKKKWKYALVIAFTLLRHFVIFLTAPGYYFMYYYSIYIIGLFILILAILCYVVHKKYKIINSEKIEENKTNIESESNTIENIEQEKTAN